MSEREQMDSDALAALVAIRKRLPDIRCCKTCGLWFGEYIACEDGGCDIETEDEAIRRHMEQAK